MARNRLPTAVQDAKGAFIGKPSRRRDAEPTTDRPLGNAPPFLSKEEKKVWRDLAKQALPGVLFESDRLMFALLVRLATKFYTGSQMMASETAQMIQLSSKFALNPADRSKVAVEKPKQSTLAAFIAKRNNPNSQQ
jgi:phage terminase small subunit